MGIIYPQGRVPKPIRFEEFENYRNLTRQQTVSEQQISAQNLFAFDRYDDAAYQSSSFTNDTTNGTSYLTLATSSEDYILTNAFCGGILTGGTAPEYIEIYVIVVRGGTVTFRMGGYIPVNTTGTASSYNVPVNNMLIKQGDIIQLECVRHTTNTNFRISGGVSLIRLTE